MNKFFLSLYLCCTTILVSLLVVTSFQERIQDRRYPIINDFKGYTSAKITIKNIPEVLLTRQDLDKQWQFGSANNVYLSKSKILSFINLLPTLSSKFERAIELKNSDFSQDTYQLNVELATEDQQFLILKFKLGSQVEVLLLPEAKHYRLRASELQTWQVKDFLSGEVAMLWPHKNPPANIQLADDKRIKFAQKSNRYTFIRPYNGYFVDPLLFRDLIQLLQQPLQFENVFYNFPKQKQLVWTNWQFFLKDKNLHLSVAEDEHGKIYLQQNRQQETLIVAQEWNAFIKNRAFDLLDKQIFTAPLKKIREIEFQHNQQYFHARFYWRQKKLLHASFEGLPLSQEQLQQYFQQISQLQYEQPLEKRFYPSGLPQAALRYRLANGKTHSIAFYSHPSSSFYAVSFDRLRPYFLASSYQFTRLQATALAMILRP